VLDSLDVSRLRLYPDPVGNALRDTIAELHGLERDNVILGNGSDDILTIAIRAFVGQGEVLACVEPTYSLYKVLAKIQGADCISVPLKDDFTLPDDLLEKVGDAKLFIIPRPNAPTGNSFSKDKLADFCGRFNGAVLIDEAYADFCSDNCLDFLPEFENVIVSRTLSKSYSLAGVRMGYALASKDIIEGLMKVKDSYNVNMLTQMIANAALRDRGYFEQTVAEIKRLREKLRESLQDLSFKVMPSETNFLFASPPDGDGEGCYNFLKARNILVRYFPGERTGKFLRISIGTELE
jgi:histidinol-phosphate aminotransferase